MYIYLDKKGVVKEIINDEALRQGNSNANTCYVYYEDYENVKSMLVSYELQDHTITQEAEVATSTTKGTIPYDAERDLKYFRDDGTIYDFFVFTIADEPLSQDGIFRMTIRFVSSDGTKISTMGLLCFNVEAEVVQSDSGITLSQYNYLVEQWYQNKKTLPIDGSLPMQGDLDMGKHNIVLNGSKLSKIDSSLAFDGEKYAKETMVDGLQSQIDTINATQNVVDIVGTKADLNSYATSDLHNKDKIEVLVDESQNNANTIYEWDLKKWSLIGSKAPYYSKSESDGKYALKEKLESVASDVGNKLDKSTFNTFYSDEFKPIEEDSEYYSLTIDTTKEELIGTHIITKEQYDAIYNNGKPKNILINNALKVRVGGIIPLGENYLYTVVGYIGLSFVIEGLVNAIYTGSLLSAGGEYAFIIGILSEPQQITQVKEDVLGLTDNYQSDAEMRVRFAKINGKSLFNSISNEQIQFNLVDLESEQTIGGNKTFTGKVTFSTGALNYGSYAYALPKKSGTIALISDIPTTPSLIEIPKDLTLTQDLKDKLSNVTTCFIKYNGVLYNGYKHDNDLCAYYAGSTNEDMETATLTITRFEIPVSIGEKIEVKEDFISGFPDSKGYCAIPSDLLVDNGKLYLTTASGQAMGSGAELPKKYRHTIVISSSNGIISMTTESSKNTVVDSVQDLISVFANTTLSACGAVQYEGGRAISIYLQVGNSISNTNIAYAPVESGTGASIELFTSIFGTSGFTITDNVTPV